MKLLQIHNLATSPGGAERVVASDGRLLEDQGADVKLLMLKTTDLQRAGNVRASLKAIWNGDVAAQTADTIQSFDPDVIHIYTPFPLMSPAVFRVASRSGVPVVTTVQSYRYSCIKGVFYRDGQTCELCKGRRLKLSGIRHRCYHNSVPGSVAMTASLVAHRQFGTFRTCVDLWLALSQFMRAKLVEEGMPADRVAVKPNTTPDLGFRPSARSPRIVFAGRLEPEKGVKTLLEAWRRAPSLPELLVFGDGSLRALVEDADLKDSRITFRGWVTQEILEDEIAAARFLVFPSEWYEGNPVTILQSLSAGTPVIASDVGNFSDIIQHGDNGYLFRSGDPGDLASVFAAAGVGPARADANMRRAARETYLQTYSEEANAKLLLSAYDAATRIRHSGKQVVG
jgi:glycosyltransferase involved in cell wall biosynthesis